MRGVCRWGARLAYARLAGAFGRFASSRPEWLRLRRPRSVVGSRSAGIVVPRAKLGTFIVSRAGCLSFGGR